MIKVSKIEYYLPENILTNEDLEKGSPEWNSDRIQEKIGIRQHCISSENETVKELSVKSSGNLFISYSRNYAVPDSCMDWLLLKV